MPSLISRSVARPLVVTSALALAALGLSSGVVPVSSAAVPKTPPPILQRGTANVTADSLPTAQIDGIVWKQTVVGNTVFAGGQFTSARPAGVARGGPGTVARHNLMSYDIRTGKMTSFAPVLNGEVRSLAVSADKKILYVGGNFTTVNGKARPAFAAFTIATGALRSTTFGLNNKVNAIVATKTTVYFGGWFTRVGTFQRSRVAAFSVATGKITAWNPKADNAVEALAVSPYRGRILIGGSFAHLGGKTARGMAQVTSGVGSLRTWKINTKVMDYGANSAILDIAVDKDTVYGAGYGYQAGNFEGVFAATPKDGTVKWLQDCHGDQYGVAPVGNLVYSVGHAHFCKNIGGFPERSPQRTLVVTKDVRGTIAKNTQTDSINYRNWAGYKAPAIYNWFPKLNTGTVSGSTQAAWTIKATSKYVVLGGEFTTVNGLPQEGLARFTTPANGAPRKMGPQGTSGNQTPAVTKSDATGRTIYWHTNYDLDDHTLTYQVVRSGVVIKTVSRASTYYDRPWITWKDTTAKPGVRYTYQIRVRDSNRNEVRSQVITSS